METVKQVLDPNVLVPLITIIGGWFGFDTWRKRRAATAAEVDRWASTAAGIVLMGVKLGAFKSDEDVVIDILDRFKKIAAAAGVEISTKHEARALTIAQEAVAAAGAAALGAELARLKGAADAMIKNMERLGKLL